MKKEKQKKKTKLKIEENKIKTQLNKRLDTQTQCHPSTQKNLLKPKAINWLKFSTAGQQYLWLSLILVKNNLT